MINIMLRIFVISLSTFLFWNCSKEGNPMFGENTLLNNEQEFTGNLELRTDKTNYNLYEILAGNYVFINATLTNTSSDTFYSRLGDGFNISVDQENLFIASYSDGIVEKNISEHEWDNVNLGLLFEGTRIIRILPSQKYGLTASAYADSNLQGKFRLKVYYSTIYSGTTSDKLKDVSNIFTISNN